MFDKRFRQVSEVSHLLNAHGLKWLGSGELAQARWRKSSRSAFNGNCVEVAELCGGHLIAVRDTKDVGPERVLIFKDEVWRSFLDVVKNGS